MPGRARTGPRAAFRRWRHGRPFWGGLLLALGGGEILLTEKASLKVVLHIGMQGLAGYLLPALMVLLGVLILVNPAQRLFYSLTGILLSLGTWLTSNLGGFFLGLLLGATGSCLAFGWLPDQEPRRGPLRRRREAAARRRSPAPVTTGEEPA
ncbi:MULTISPECIES: DUF6114 domain-containing protein [Streptomyces]|uniref:Integral membrane protein n=2 Tax=Streptomyces TaxID=1883 RepID=A0A2U9PAT1_STRAS|nr:MULTISPECIES: DUF6114 domain-containing protein [Streptomyces]AWT46078.1 hypothetical protein DMT42_29810 [Streptomyces actuosus]MBM4822738.1 hypothetical protein [Streptomyces actuosus]GHF47417.1 hypothetical protein GCM10018783_15840 [Streptomyces griseosporeus]